MGLGLKSKHGCSLPHTRSPCSSFLSQNLTVSSWSKTICSYLKMSYTILDSAFKKKKGRKILHWGESFCLIRSSRCHRLKKARKFQAKGRYFTHNSTPPGSLHSFTCLQTADKHQEKKSDFFFFGDVNSCHNLGIALSFNLIRI